jgi:hypothetical protein
VTGAFYAKSIGGWLMLAPILLVWLLSPERKILFTLKFWMAGVLSGLLCLLYYFTRELTQPGFLSLVWHSEYMRMFHNVMPWHEHSASYYFKNFIILRTFTPWIYILMAAMVYSLFLLKERETRNHLMQWMILGMGFMLVITIPAVKLEWYDAPAYPFFALITGTVAGILVGRLPGQWRLLVLIPVLFVLGRKIMFERKDTLPRHPFEYEGSILRSADVNPATKVFLKVETPEHQLQLDFYRKLKWYQEGIKVSVIDTSAMISPGDKLIISQEGQLSVIEQQFDLDTLKVWPGLGYELNVAGKKPGHE